MKYAFIDYENLHTLDDLPLQEFAKIFVFIGANQNSIKLSNKFNDELNLTIITIKHIGQNNLDFHLAYYLGKLDCTEDKNIEFHLFSKDKGYDGLCDFIQNQKFSRICVRKHIEKIESAVKTAGNVKSDDEWADIAFKAYCERLKDISKPRKISTLQNSIHNHCFKEQDKNQVLPIIQKVIKALEKNQYIVIDGSKVTHNKILPVLNSAEIGKKEKIEKMVIQYQHFLQKIEIKNRPNNLVTLKNSIYNQTGLNQLGSQEELTPMIVKVINKLRNAKVLNINMNTNMVTYLI